LVETAEDHLARHPAAVEFKRECSRCKYLVMMPRARKHCVFKDEVTGERFQWLMEQPDPTKPWGLGCIVCRAAGSNTKMGRCEFGMTLGSMTLQNLGRHGNNNPRKTTAASVGFEHSEVWQANFLK
jgi:hypothetical protein